MTDQGTNSDLRNGMSMDTEKSFQPPPPPSPSDNGNLNLTQTVKKFNSRRSSSSSSSSSSCENEGFCMDSGCNGPLGAPKPPATSADNDLKLTDFYESLRPFLTIKEDSQGFSSNGVIVQPRPAYYFTYPQHATHLSHKPLNFYIEGPYDEKGIIYPDSRYFVVNVHNPAGKSCPVSVKLDDAKPLRYICSFEPLNWGTYTGSVQVGADGQHIAGSPLEFLVSSSSLSSPTTSMSAFQSVSSTSCKARLIPDVVERVVAAFSPRVTRVSDSDEREFASAWGIAVDSLTGKIFVADKVRNRIRTLSSDGKILKDFVSQDRLRGPMGLAVDPVNKRILVANFMGNRISIYSLNTGEFVYSFGRKGAGDGEFNGPWGLAVSPNGNRIAVSDAYNHRIQLFDKKGNFLRKFSVMESDPFRFRDEFYGPRGICFDNAGKYIYVADVKLGLVSRLNSDLTEKSVIIGRGGLSRPQGIAIDASGKLLIADAGDKSIQVALADGTRLHSIDNRAFDPQGIVSIAMDRLALLNRSGAVLLCKF